MLLRTLAQTAPLWPPIRLSYSWVHRAAHILSNEESLRVEQSRRDYRHLLAEMSRRKEQTGALSGAVSLLLKVTKSYWKGLLPLSRGNLAPHQQRPRALLWLGALRRATSEWQEGSLACSGGKRQRARDSCDSHATGGFHCRRHTPYQC